MVLTAGLHAVPGSAFVTTDLRVESVTINFTDSWLDIWQWLYDLLLNEESLDEAITSVLQIGDVLIAPFLNGTGTTGSIATALDGILATRITAIQNTLGSGVSLPGGGGFSVGNIGFLNACAPMGCQGGEILMSARGLETMASASINDTLPAGAPRRFPFVYAPPQSPGIASLIQTRTSPSGFAFDLGLFVNGALLNHGFRALAEGGLLDQALTVAGGQVQLRALAAPQYLPGAGTGGKPLNILIPNLLITNSAGTRVTADLALGVDATVDPGTGQLVPTADVGFKFTVLGCEGGPVLCDLTNSAVVAALQDAILQYVVNPLLANSIGQIALPSVLGLVVSGAKVESIGGTLAVMVNAAPSPRATATAAFSGGNPHTAPTSFSTTVNPADRKSVV